MKKAELTKIIKFIETEIHGYDIEFDYEIGDKEISNCLSGVQKDSYVAINDEVKYIFRKLTPRECFRLQGFDDSFIFPPKMSDTQLYKQAGNGMSRNVLDMIFTQIFKSKNFDLSSNS
jgi:site-specific DNA-cytosine methylase